MSQSTISEKESLSAMLSFSADEDSSTTALMTQKSTTRTRLCSSHSDSDGNDSSSPFDDTLETSNAANKILRKLNTQLLWAVEEGACEDDITRLLDAGASPNASCWLNYVSACHLATLKDDDSLSILIKAGAIITRADGWGRTPLHLAAWAGNNNQISLLLNNVEGVQNKDETLSIAEEELRIIRLKLSHIYKACEVGEAQDLPEDWRDSTQHTCMLTSQKLPIFECGWTALHSASSGAQHQSVRLLLEHGADPDIQDFNGRTPLDVVGDQHGYAQKITVMNFLKTVKVLTSANGHIYPLQAPNSTKVNTSLHVAVELKCKEAISELLDAGAKPIWHNNNGLTALHLCVKYKLGPHLELLANYAYKGDNKEPVMEVKDNKGLTVLHAAVRTSWSPGVRIAFDAGATIVTLACDGEGPIHYATAIGNIEMVKLLLSFSPDCINTVNEKGHTALFVAIIHDHFEIVKLLIKNHASLRVIDPYGNAFHFAAEYGRLEILKFILSIDSNTTNNLINERFVPGYNSESYCSKHGGWYTPIIYAIEKNHPACVDLLLRNGARINVIVPFYDNTVSKKIIWATALNIATIKNNLEIAKILINFDKQCINLANFGGALPLQEACIHKNKDFIKLLIQEGADLSFGGFKLKPSIELLMNHIPNPTDFLEEILDSNISSQGNVHEKDYKVTLDYSVLWQSASYKSSMNVVKALINTGNRHGQRKLLFHPLIESFLFLQWEALRPFYYLILVFYGLFIISVNMYTVSIFYCYDENILNLINGTITKDNLCASNIDPYHLNLYYDVCKAMIFIIFGVIITQEIFFLRATRKLFLESWVKLGALVSSLSVPLLISYQDVVKAADVPVIPDGVRVVASIAVFLTWLEMMFLLSRFPSWCIFMVMFEKVATKVLKILLAFGFLIIGISLCFMIQFGAKVPFDGPYTAITKTLIMMISGNDYAVTLENTFFDINFLAFILQVLFIIFVIIASIVLMNLFVGTAVYEVNHIEKAGNQKGILNQVDFLISLQSSLSIYLIQIMFPNCYNETFLFRKRKFICLKPNVNTCIYSKILPSHIRDAILNKALLNLKKMDENKVTLNYGGRLNEINSAFLNDDYLQKLNTTMENLRKDINYLRNDHKSIKPLLMNFQNGLSRLRSRTV